MSKIEKRLQKFFGNPTSLKYHEIKQLLQTFGFQEMAGKGSHKKFKNPTIPYPLTIPFHGKDCKPIYKIKAANLLKILCNFER